MKKIITVIAIAITLTSVAQSKDSTITKDSNKEALTDSTAIFSVNDVKPLYAELRKLSYETAKPFIDYLDQLLYVRTKQYGDKHKKTK